MSQIKTVIAIVGGGPAGFFSAINIKEKKPKARVILLEATSRVLTKVKISGGGRCNVTHHLFEPDLLAKSYPRGSKQLRQAFFHFQPKDTIEWFEKRGVKLKTEKDGRMFPESNKSDTIIDCLMKEASNIGVELELRRKVDALEKNEGGFKIVFSKDEPLQVDKLVLATGSSPLGHELATSLGHKIIDPVPSLFTFNIKSPLLEDLMGQSFEEVSLELSFPKEHDFKTYKQKGPLLITHWGLSGPAVLKLSAFAARDLKKTSYQADLKINFLGDKKISEVENFLLEYKENHKSDLLGKLGLFSLTKRFWCRCLDLCFISQTHNWQDISKKQIQSLALLLTGSLVKVEGKGIFKEEFVTAGGVCLSEINFKTMESKQCSGLYFSGEILDVDGITGGFNFQNAWTSAWLISEALKD